METAGWSGVRDWRVTLRALGSRSVLLPPSRERLAGAVVVAVVGLSLALILALANPWRGTSFVSGHPVDTVIHDLGTGYFRR